MTSISPAIAPDRFCWSRVGAIMRLMLPRLRVAMTAYLAVGIVTSLLLILLHNLTFFLRLLPFVVIVAGILYYIAPIFVTSAIAPRQFAALPATPGEKLTAVGIYSLIILPLLAYYIPQLLTTLFILNGDYFSSIGITMGCSSSFLHDMNPILWGLNYLSSFLPGVVCLYTAFVHPGKKWIQAATGLSVVLLLGLSGGIVGGLYAFFRGYNAAVAGELPADVDSFTIEIVTALMPYIWVMTLLCIGLSILFLRLTYRRIATGRF